MQLVRQQGVARTVWEQRSGREHEQAMQLLGGQGGVLVSIHQMHTTCQHDHDSTRCVRSALLQARARKRVWAASGSHDSGKTAFFAVAPPAALFHQLAYSQIPGNRRAGRPGW
jgi:hypothetical protein